MRAPQTVRVAIPSLIAAALSTVTVTWPTAFGSTSYTVALCVDTGGVTGILATLMVKGRTTSAITVEVTNVGLVTMASGTLHAMAIAD